MQQATPTDITAARYSSDDATRANPDTAVRVVTPVGGRGGWRQVHAATPPQTKEPSQPENLVDDDATRNWLRTYLQCALERDDRILLILFHFEGLNAREIGAVVDATEAAVEVRLEELNRLVRTSFRDFMNERTVDGTDNEADPETENGATRK